MMPKRGPGAQMPERALPPQDSYMIPEMPYMPEQPIMQPMPWQGCSPHHHCIPQETFLTNVRLARAYVPFQKLCNTFSPVEGLVKGTIFPELFSPYEGENKKCRPPEYD
jgi:hypothetical protein